jgi:alpha-ketoglutarate-dependent taurine dioxygenase
MTKVEARDITPAFGSEISAFDPRLPLDADSREVLEDLFDRRGLLVFRSLDIDHAQQVTLSKTMIRQTVLDEGGVRLSDREGGKDGMDDNFYVSNRRPGSAAPFGRLQFHSDAMWCDRPVEVLSLYAVEVEEPCVPTTFVSARQAWATLPDKLRERVEGLSALHTAGQLRRGDLSDVLVSTFENAPSTVKPIGLPHPRTGENVLYICEQMTQDVVGLEPDQSEGLLDELFTHMYDPSRRLNHHWREGDLVVWDNIAVQHARPNVLTDGPARTLRKFFSPVPQLRPDQMPTFSSAS